MLEDNKFLKKYKLDFRLVREIDKALLISVLILILFGMFNIYLCTKGGVGNITYPYYFVKKQGIWFIKLLVSRPRRLPKVLVKFPDVGMGFAFMPRKIP